MQRPIEKNFKFSPFATKPQIAKIVKRCLLVGKKVLYKSPSDIPFKLSTLRAVNGQFVFPRITQTAIAQTPDPEKNPKKWHFSFHIVTDLCQFMVANSEIWGVKKNQQLFDISKIATLWPSKQPISHVFKNPYQGK